MAATAVIGSCTTTTFFPYYLQKLPRSHKLSPLSPQFIHSYKISAPQICSQSALMRPRSVSSPETGIAEDQEQSDDDVSTSFSSLPPLTEAHCNLMRPKEIKWMIGEGKLHWGGLCKKKIDAGVVKGVEERRLKGVVMVKEGFKVGLPRSQALVGGRSRLIALVLHICSPVAGTDEAVKAWMKLSLDRVLSRNKNEGPQRSKMRYPSQNAS